MNDLLRDLVLLFTGWLLGILTTAVENRRKSRREYRILFGRCYRIAEEIAIKLAVSEAWNEAGLIRTIDELFDDDSSTQVNLPPSPPRLPDDFNEVLNRLFEYEATHPDSRLGKQFITVRNWVVILNQIHAGLKATSEGKAHAELPKRALMTYQDTWNDLREYLKPIIKELDYRRSSYVIRLFKIARNRWRKLASSKRSKSVTRHSK